MEQVIKVLAELSRDQDLPRNVRSALEEIRISLEAGKDVEVKIDAALQQVEGLSLDPNLSSYGRGQLWNLTSLLEGALGK